MYCHNKIIYFKNIVTYFQLHFGDTYDFYEVSHRSMLARELMLNANITL